MNFIVIIISFLVFTFTSCTSEKVIEHPSQVPRDNTITPETSYNDLFLDSLKVDKFIRIEVNDTIYNLRIKNFYNSRNFQFAWFDEKGITEHATAFWNLHEMRADSLIDSSFFNRQLHENMNILLTEDLPMFSNEDLQNMELRLTFHFFKYLNSHINGKMRPEEMQWHIPRRKVDVQALISSFLEGNKEWKPLHRSFYRLENKMLQYAAIASKGYWPNIELRKTKLRKGDVNPLIPLLKERLRITNDFPFGDTSMLFNDSLKISVMKMQRSYGLKVTGIINEDFVKQLNVPVAERIIQMKINLERMRWLPREEANRIIVNIPEYKLHVFKHDTEVLNINIVVGKAAHRTVIFSDQLQYIVFNPYWNIPRSITKNEILPAIDRNKKYLDRNNMEITGYNDGLPNIRQKPGKGNALGKVKFIFPNRYNIYFHDTPTKSLFQKQKRAFSHGCIRLQDPIKLAKYLLKDDSKWTDRRMRSTLNQGSEKWVKMDNPIPVYIIYLTSWVDSDGLVHFRDDIYGHDKRMYDHLFHKF